MRLKKHIRNLKTQRHFFVLLTTVVLTVPNALALFVYNLQDPHYEASMNLLPEPFAVDESAAASLEEASDNVGFIDCFNTPIWTSFSPEKKVTVLQLFADYEAAPISTMSL